jgi:hypothetical protein
MILMSLSFAERDLSPCGGRRLLRPEGKRFACSVFDGDPKDKGQNGEDKGGAREAKAPSAVKRKSSETLLRKPKGAAIRRKGQSPEKAPQER